MAEAQVIVQAPVVVEVIAEDAAPIEVLAQPPAVVEVLGEGTQGPMADIATDLVAHYILAKS